MVDSCFFFFFKLRLGHWFGMKCEHAFLFQSVGDMHRGPGSEVCGERGEDRDLGGLVLAQALPLTSCVAHGQPLHLSTPLASSGCQLFYRSLVLVWLRRPGLENVY